MSATFPALVVSVGKNAAWVALDGEEAQRIAAIKRASGKRTMPVPGDRIDVRLLEDGRVLIERVHPRAFTLQRRSVGGRTKIMAANVDALITVTSLAQPPPRLLILDQLLAFAEFESLAVSLVFTKPDLAPPGEEAKLSALYANLGYEVLVVNPKAGDGLAALRAALTGRRGMLCGVSGVGKSSLFRALGGPAVVGAVSQGGIGRQTTTASHLYRMPGGYLIDSPGVAEFGLGAPQPRELAAGFREIARGGEGCRFTDCTHLREPGCAVADAAAAGRIAASRYENYRQLALRGGKIPAGMV